MALYVTAHTSAYGSHERSTAYVTTITPRVGSPGRVTHNVKDAACFRQEPENGLYHSDFSTFRKPTVWNRFALRTYDLSGGYNYVVGTTVYRCPDSRTIYGIPWDVERVGEGGTFIADHNQRERAEAEALLKVRDQKVNLGTTLAEARKTMSMVASRVTSLVRFYRALRSGNVSYAYYVLFGRSYRGDSNKVRTAADAWLEWQYGWRPLIDDVWNGIELIREGARQRQLVFSVERTITDRLDPAGLVSSTYRKHISVTGERTLSTRVKLWGCMRDSLLYVPSQLGLINPAAIAWELTPYSFVLDWLVPVGTWLESFTAVVGVDFVAGYVTHVEKAKVVAVRETWDNKPSSVFTRPKSRYELYHMARRPYSSWPWVLPYVKNPFSTSHLASAAALLSNTRRKP